MISMWTEGISDLDYLAQFVEQDDDPETDPKNDPEPDPKLEHEPDLTDPYTRRLMSADEEYDRWVEEQETA